MDAVTTPEAEPQPALGAIKADLDWMSETLGELSGQLEGMREFMALVAHKQEHVLRLLAELTGEDPEPFA